MELCPHTEWRRLLQSHKMMEHEFNQGYRLWMVMDYQAKVGIFLVNLLKPAALV